METMNKPVLVVMAAGMGSRYGGLKQIEPIGPNGEIIVDYALYDAIRAGFQSVVFIIRGELEQTFHEVIGKRVSDYMKVQYVHQSITDLPAGRVFPVGRIKPWGTGHAVLACRKAVDAPFAVIGSDDYFGPESFKRIYDFLAEPPRDSAVYQYGMVGYRLANTVSEYGSVARGVCELDGEGYLTGVRERTRIEKRPDGIAYSEDDGSTWVPLPGESIVSMNMWGFQPSMFHELERSFEEFLDRNADNPIKSEFFLPDVPNRLIQEGKARVKVLETNDKWYGVTYREDRDAVAAAFRAMHESGLYPSPLLR